MSHLTVSFLGTPRIERDGVPVVPDSRKAVALLAYLAITGQPQSREALMTLLWPESDQGHAHNTLRYTLSVLKKAIDGVWLDAGRESIGLHHSPNLWLDVDHFHRQLAICRTHGHREADVCPACAPALARGGCAPVGSSSYNPSPRKSSATNKRPSSEKVIALTPGGSFATVLFTPSGESLPTSPRHECDFGDQHGRCADRV